MHVDDSGELELRAPAAEVGWVRGQAIGLTVEEGAILRLSDTRGAFLEAEGFVAQLDDCWRLHLSGTVGAMTGLEPGVSAVAMVTVARGLAVLPIGRLVHERSDSGARLAPTRSSAEDVAVPWC